MGLAPLGIVHTIYWFREPMTRALGLWAGTFCLPRVHTNRPNGPLRNTRDSCSLWSTFVSFSLGLLLALPVCYWTRTTSTRSSWGGGTHGCFIIVLGLLRLFLYFSASSGAL